MHWPPHERARGQWEKDGKLGIALEALLLWCKWDLSSTAQTDLDQNMLELKEDQEFGVPQMIPFQY